MSIQKLMVNYTCYNCWVNQKYNDWLRPKPRQLLFQETPSSFPTIIQTLNHIWSTQEFWRGIIAETSDVVNKYDSTTFDPDEIFDGIKVSSEKLKQFLDGLPGKDLERNLKVVTPWFQCDLPRYEYVQHVISHGIYHRGQIVTMGRQIGITDAPMTDYNYYNVFRE
jgi:uncharacterized damage-inducible protein DinB